jgi:hypothetical protein
VTAKTHDDLTVAYMAGYERGRDQFAPQLHVPDSAVEDYAPGGPLNPDSIWQSEPQVTPADPDPEPETIPEPDQSHTPPEDQGDAPEVEIDLSDEPGPVDAAAVAWTENQRRELGHAVAEAVRPKWARFGVRKNGRKPAKPAETAEEPAEVAESGTEPGKPANGKRLAERRWPNGKVCPRCGLHRAPSCLRSNGYCHDCGREMDREKNARRKAPATEEVTR